VYGNPAIFDGAPKETDLLDPFETRILQNQAEQLIREHSEVSSSLELLSHVGPDLDARICRPASRYQFGSDVPATSVFHAHAKMRVALELAFSGCLAEARSILRDAIEFVAQTHAVCTDTVLQKVWLEKNDGAAALKAFTDAFERHKKTGLFHGLAELHRK